MQVVLCIILVCLRFYDFWFINLTFIICWIYRITYWIKIFLFFWNKRVTESLLLTLELRKAVSFTYVVFHNKKTSCVCRGWVSTYREVIPAHLSTQFTHSGIENTRWYFGMTEISSKWSSACFLIEAVVFQNKTQFLTGNPQGRGSVLNVYCSILWSTKDNCWAILFPQKIRHRLIFFFFFPGVSKAILLWEREEGDDWLRTEEVWTARRQSAERAGSLMEGF